MEGGNEDSNRYPLYLPCFVVYLFISDKLIFFYFFIFVFCPPELFLFSFLFSLESSAPVLFK